MIIHIETSTTVCSVALSEKGKIYFEKVANQSLSHAALIGPFVEEVLKTMRDRGGILEAVAISGGPGSYTGLRIGTSFAKGLCFGFDVPLIAIPTLEILALAAINSYMADSSALYCPMLDARRMEVYYAIYDAQLSPVSPVSPEIITSDSFSENLKRGEICFFGDGSTKCKDVILSPNAIFIDNLFPLAKNMIPLAEKAFEQGSFVDVAYFEPFYLKEFQATIAKNKVINDAIKMGLTKR